MADRGAEDESDMLGDIEHEADEADEIAAELPELFSDPADESAEEAAMHIEYRNRL